ncbi:MAG: hypothetical protein E7670_04175 [Ruminococcaceae bacterium]|nr:hypothetical protein [Oscillospiraceae bacterium]
MKKRVFYSELAYVFGILILAIGTAFIERADFGVSMVVAPAYILHLKISQFLPFFSFGMAEYTLQAIILLCMVIFLRKAKLSYLFSLVTAVIYGLLLDCSIALISFVPFDTMLMRILFYVFGMLLCSCGVALLFHTYISPEAYELFVKEISAKYNINIHKFKTIYDCASCLIAIALSFAFFGFWHFEGINVGTVICALLNGTLIKMFTKILEKIWTFGDALPFKKYF